MQIDLKKSFFYFIQHKVNLCFLFHKVKDECEKTSSPQELNMNPNYSMKSFLDDTFITFFLWSFH